MHVEASVTSVTWIPSEVFKGMIQLGMDLKLSHYDEAPPDVIHGAADLEKLRAADKLRMANLLSAAAVFDGEKPSEYAYTGHGVVGSTTASVGKVGMTFAGVAMPTIQREPEVGPGWVRFVQTVGGRTGAPMPRKVPHPPFVQWHAPIAWTTLSLTLHHDGRNEWAIDGASGFPRHWVYGPDGQLAAKTGVIDTAAWMKHSFGERTPWGDHDSPAVVTAIETALERELSSTLMSGSTPTIREHPVGTVMSEQGTPGTSLLVLLDGVLSVEVDGRIVAEVGPGAVMGERAILDGGLRSSTLTALTPVRVATAEAAQIDRESLAKLASGHRREDQLA